MKKNWFLFLELVTLGALLFAPLTLLFVDQGLLFPYITSKNFAWRIAIEVAFAGWLSLSLLDARYRINLKHPLVLSFGTFMLVMLLANLSGIDPFRSFWSNAERMDGYVGLLHLFAFFLAGYGFFHSQKKASATPTVLWGIAIFAAVATTYQYVLQPIWANLSGVVLVGTLALAGAVMYPTLQRSNIMRIFLHGLLALGVFLGMLALFQDKTRVDSVLGNPIYLASYATFSLFISGYFLIQRDKFLNSHAVSEVVLYSTLILFNLWIIFETGTRGAILGLVFGGTTTALLVALFARSKEEKMWRYLAIGFLLFISVVTVGFFATKDVLLEKEVFAPGSLFERAAGFSLEDRTTKHRLANWGIALEGVAERPLLGWGQENYIHVFSKHYTADTLYDAEQWFDRTHNMFLDWLVFGGILGLGSFLGILIIAIWIIWRRSGDLLSTRERALLTGLLVAYMAQNFVAFDALATGIWFSTLLIMIALIYKSPESARTESPIRREIVAFAIVGIWISTFVWMSYSVWKPRETMYNFMPFLHPIPAQVEKSDALIARYPSLEDALAYHHPYRQEYIEQLLNRYTIYLNEDVDQEVRLLYGQTVINKTEEAIEQHPHVTRLLLFYGNFLVKTGNHEQAREYLERALLTSPDKISILWLLAHTESNLGNNQAALDYYAQAAELAPEYKQAQETLERAQAQLSEN